MKKRTSNTPKPEVVEDDFLPGDDGLQAFGVQMLQTNASGELKGLLPRTRYYVVAREAKGLLREVQLPPAAKLRPPRVRRSILITVEGDDPDENPPRPA